jgi:hypothetical protein
MFKLTQKDCLHCLSCVAFAVLLNLVVPYVMKLLVKSPDRSNVLGRVAGNIADRAEHPLESSVVLALMVFVACCLGQSFPLFR